MKDTGSRFEIDIEGQTVFADYRLEDKTLYITHVESPPALRGRGAAGQLMQQIIEKTQKETLTVVPICGYAASWIKRNT